MESKGYKYFFEIGDSTGNLINITGITAKDPAITKISNFKPNSTVDPNPLIRSGSSYTYP